jgi:uncharacterized membrane protein YqaE (UPF0057 family)
MSNLVLAIICICLPPLAVFLKKGLEQEFWINLILSILGVYILGLIHGLYVIFSDPD